MKSTDTNLNNPLSMDGLDLFRTVESSEFPLVVQVTQDLYDLLQTKDPYTIYVITDSQDGRIYYGQFLITKPDVESKYFIGFDENGYTIYQNLVEDHRDHLIPICMYRDPQDAMDILIMCNNIGSSKKMDMHIYNSVCAFIDGFVNVHDLIVGILCVFGYKNDPRLNMIIDIGTSFGANQTKMDLPVIFREELPTLADRYNNKLFKTYSDIFNVIMKYDFFKDEKYHKGIQHLDLTEPVADFHKVYSSSHKSI